MTNVISVKVKTEKRSDVFSLFSGSAYSCAFKRQRCLNQPISGEERKLAAFHCFLSPPVSLLH